VHCLPFNDGLARRSTQQTSAGDSRAVGYNNASLGSVAGSWLRSAHLQSYQEDGNHEMFGGKLESGYVAASGAVAIPH
jgi:hypothetical protein